MISPLGHKWILTPHSWCEPGNQKDWPIRGEHSVYRIFNFDDMDIEKKNMIFDNVSSWFVPIIQVLLKD